MTSTSSTTRTGGVFKRTTTSGDRWDVMWRTAEGKQRRRTFTSYREACEFKHATERDVRRGEHVDKSRAADVPTVAEAVRTWSTLRGARGKQRDSSRAAVESFVTHHLDRTDLGRMRVCDVTEDDVLVWLADRRTVLSGSTLRNRFKYVRAAFRWAVDRRFIAVSPVTVDVVDAQPEADTAEAQPLTRAEVDALREQMPEHLRLWVTLGVGTGMRPGEQRGLRVSDVLDSPRGAVIPLREQSRGDGSRGPLKTRRSRRDVVLSEGVAAAVREHVIRFGLSGDDHLFSPGGSTGPYSANGLAEVFTRAARRAGLPATTTPHKLRHTHVSWLIDAGLSEVEIGDATETVGRTYAHLLRDRDDRLRDVVDAALFGAAAEPGRALRAL